MILIPKKKTKMMLLLLGAILVGGLGFYVATQKSSSPPIKVLDNTPVLTQIIEPSFTGMPNIPVGVEIVD